MYRLVDCPSDAAIDLEVDHREVAASHSRAVLSEDAVTISLPLGLNAALETGSV
jgi:hypothetical protein